VAEPVKRTLRIYRSLEEANEAELLRTIEQTPEERVAEAVELILRVYGFTRESLKQRKPDTRVRITRYE
jgi:hypothetical protein